MVRLLLTSRTSTDLLARVRVRAAVRPANPDPMTITSNMVACAREGRKMEGMKERWPTRRDRPPFALVPSLSIDYARPFGDLSARSCTSTYRDYREYLITLSAPGVITKMTWFDIDTCPG
jgi:hypothetical protein